MKTAGRVERIISGGQTGVDQGALHAAEQIGIETGGWMPNGAKTEVGLRPDIAERFGLQIASSPGYPQRTRMVVLECDAMLVFHRDVGKLGPGTLLTLRLCWSLGRPVWLCRAGVENDEQLAARFIDATKAKILAVGGSRESKAHGIQDATEASLVYVLSLVKKMEVPA